MAELRTLAHMSGSRVRAALDVSKSVLSVAAVEEEISSSGGSSLRLPLQDVHFSKLQQKNSSDWELVCDVSPRTARLRGHFHSAVVVGPGSDSEEADPQVVPGEAVFCTPCNKLLNSAHQYMQHLKGNHHRKTMNRLREQGRAVSDRCGQVGAAVSSASAPAGRPDGGPGRNNGISTRTSCRASTTGKI